jgi:hypothetical protein
MGVAIGNRCNQHIPKSREMASHSRGKQLLGYDRALTRARDFPGGWAPVRRCFLIAAPVGNCVVQSRQEPGWMPLAPPAGAGTKRGKGNISGAVGATHSGQSDVRRSV